MKMRHLTRKSGSAVVSVWPPLWATFYSAGDRFAIGDEGVLQSVRRVEDRLSLTMKYDGREHVGSLQWTPPPTLDAVEKTLKASVGETIKAIGDLDV